MNTSGEWYHGDLTRWDDLAKKQMDVEDYTRDRNAMGPGIYWTRLKWQARGYATDNGTGWLYTATMELNPSRVLTAKVKPNRRKLAAFINQAPKDGLEDQLANYDQNPIRARETAIRLEMDSSESLLSACIGLYNTLFQHDSKAFGKAMTAIGYDAYFHQLPEVDHLVVYNPKVINIKSIEDMNNKIEEKMASDNITQNVIQTIHAAINHWTQKTGVKKPAHWQNVLMTDLCFAKIADQHFEHKPTSLKGYVFRKEDVDYEEDHGYYVLHTTNPVVEVQKRLSDDIIKDAYDEAAETVDVSRDTDMTAFEGLKHITPFSRFR